MPQSLPGRRLRSNLPRGGHCPKCQAGAAKAWLAAREAELLPVRYFHLVFTLPKQIADIAHQNKREIYNLLMRASADTVIFDDFLEPLHEIEWAVPSRCLQTNNCQAAYAKEPFAGPKAVLAYLSR